MTLLQVSSKERIELSPSSIEDFLKPFSNVVLDAGAGDGKGSLRFAKKNPSTAVIALDSSFDALEKTSKTAMKKASRGGTPNLLCIYGDVKEINTLINNKFQDVRIYLPWGSLLESIASLDQELFSSIVDSCVDGAEIKIVINAEIWNENLPQKFAGLETITPDFFIDRAKNFSELGIEITETKLLDLEEIKSLDTTWTAKLMSSRSNADFVMAKGVVKKSSL